MITVLKMLVSTVSKELYNIRRLDRLFNIES